MKRNINLISYLPLVLQEYKEIKTITDIENPEFETIVDISEKILNNMFIQSSDLDGIKKYENLLKIKPSINDNLDTRIFRVLSRWNDRIPYTWKTLLNKLDLLCGKNNYEIELLNDEYRIELTTYLGVYGSIDELNFILDVMIPCNLILTVNNILENKIQTSLYFGCAISNSFHYVLSSDIDIQYSPEANLSIGSTISKASGYQLTNDFEATITSNGTVKDANVSVVGSHIEIS